MEPLITTVIPTYRRPQLLDRAVRSALAQTYPRLKVCVYDNASGDETAAVVERIAAEDDRVFYWRNPENIGATRNFMLGLSRVDTDYFSILSDDDILLPDFYEMAMKRFAEHPEAIMSVMATLQVNAKGRLIRAPVLSWRDGLYRPPDGLLAMLNGRHPEWTSVLFRRRALEVAALDPEVGGAMDLDFELALAARHPLVASTTPGAIFVAHAGGASGTTALGLVWPGWLRMMRKITEDSSIPLSARQGADETMTNQLKTLLFVRNGLGSVVRRNWPDALGAADVLEREFGLWGKAALLRFIVRCCRHIPPSRSVLCFVYSVRAFCVGRNRADLKTVRERYGAYFAGLTASASRF